MLVVIILYILLAWLVMAAVCMGIGSLLLRVFYSAEAPSHSPHFVSFWTGLALITGILQLYHFLRPIDPLIVSLLCVLALPGLFFSLRRSDLSTFRSADVFLFSLVAVIIAFRSAAPTEHYDTGLYGAQAIRWFTTYPLVPGFGNLLSQLGLNSSIFLCIAALNHGPWRDLSHHLFAGFLLAAFFAPIIPATLGVFRGREVAANDWFLTILFLPAAIWAATGKLSGANTDLPTTLVSLTAAFFFFCALNSQTHESTRENNHADTSSSRALVVAMLLFSLAATFKLSSMVFGFSGWIVSFLALCCSNAGSSSQRKRLAVAAILLSAAMVLPWICRGLVLTGYPVFPSTTLGISADWKVPAINAQSLAEFARSFARIPQIPLADTSGFHWLRPWFRELVREREGFQIPFVFMLAGVIAIFRNSHASRFAFRRWLWLLVPSFAGMLFWFFGAPAIRFGESVFWTAAATLGTFAALQFLDSPGKRRFFLFALLLVTAWAAHPRLLWDSYIRPSLTVRTIPRLPQARLVLHQTSSGLMVYMPVETNQCWDAPLPCSPYFNDTLRLRRPGDMASGFVSNDVVTGGKIP